MKNQKKNGNGTTPVRKSDIERTEHYEYREFESSLQPAKIEFKPQYHLPADCTYGLMATDVLNQIALYDFARETYADVIYGDYGGVAENVDIILRAWTDADQVVQICKEFIEMIKNQDEDEAKREMDKQKREGREANGK